ncbi:MAG: hypothetical protein D6732_20240 [Methanobacteriota archaeon]|nr:MAG: hypothetical protein D6732_20240 [Euryarchaeota archaeon]
MDAKHNFILQTHDHTKDRFFLFQTFLEVLIINILFSIGDTSILLSFYPFLKLLQYFFLKGRKLPISVHNGDLVISKTFPWQKKIVLERPKVGFQIYPQKLKWKAYVGFEGILNGKLRRIVFRVVWSDIFEIEAFFRTANLPIKTPRFWY